MVQEADGEELGGAHQHIGPRAGELVQHRVQPVLEHRAAKPHRPGHCAQRAGDLPRTVPQVGLARLHHAAMFRHLPRHDEQPRAEQKPGHPAASLLAVHAVGFRFRYAVRGDKANYLPFLTGASFFTGTRSKKRSSSCSETELVIASDWFNSPLTMPESCEGAFTMCGVRNISSSVFSCALLLVLNRLPISGMSPRKGILLSDEDLVFEMRPPMTTVCASGVTTTVSAERIKMLGAKTGVEAVPSSELPAAINWPGVEVSTDEVWGWTIISTRPFSPM